MKVRWLHLLLAALVPSFVLPQTTTARIVRNNQGWAPDGTHNGVALDTSQYQGSQLHSSERNPTQSSSAPAPPPPGPASAGSVAPAEPEEEEEALDGTMTGILAVGGGALCLCFCCSGCFLFYFNYNTPEERERLRVERSTSGKLRKVMAEPEDSIPINPVRPVSMKMSPRQNAYASASATEAGYAHGATGNGISPSPRRSPNASPRGAIQTEVPGARSPRGPSKSPRGSVNGLDAKYQHPDAGKSPRTVQKSPRGEAAANRLANLQNAQAAAGVSPRFSNAEGASPAKSPRGATNASPRGHGNGVQKSPRSGSKAGDGKSPRPVSKSPRGVEKSPRGK